MKKQKNVQGYKQTPEESEKKTKQQKKQKYPTNREIGNMVYIYIYI